MHFKITRYIQIFVEVIPTLLFFRILDASIPIRTEVELILFAQLHVKFRISRIHTCLDTVLYYIITTAGLRILMCILTYATECQIRTEPQDRIRMRIYQCVTDQDTIFMMYKQFLLLQDYPTYTVQSCRQFLTLKFTDVFMATRAVIVSVIFVQSQIKLCPVLDYRFVQRRKQHMVLVIQFRNRND